MKLLVWNVAGWQPAAKQIVESTGSVDRWLDLHAADIVALQETKVKRSTLETDAAGSAFAPSNKFDTFWCPNRQSGAKSGLNGVATFARTGMTKWAEPASLRDEVLDCEGRCLLTCHNDFVLFNIYVPATGNARGRLPHKHRFLRALQHRALEEHNRGYNVIVAGDFNMAYRPEDVHWRHRLLNLSTLESNSSLTTAPAATKVAPLIQRVRELLRAMQVVLVPAKSRSAMQIIGQRQTDSYQAKIPVDAAYVPHNDKGSLKRRPKNSVPSDDGSENRLQASSSYTHESTAEEAEASQNPTQQQLEDGREIIWMPIGKKFDNVEDAHMRLGLDEVIQEDANTGEPFTAWPKDRLSVEHLCDVLRAIDQPLSESEQRELSERWGETYSSPCDLKWIQSFMNQLDMVDVFRELHTNARERFTAWDQYTNKRYENIGARIDLTLVGRSLFERHVARGSSPLQGGNQRISNDSEEAACRAAVAKQESGLQYQPAPFDGGGISEAPMQLIDEQYKYNGSGIVYTPPKWSDHAAISLFMPVLPSRAGDAAQLCNDKSTRAAQPHKQNKSIKQMFQNAPAKSGTSESLQQRKSQQFAKKAKGPQQADLWAVLGKRKSG